MQTVLCNQKEVEERHKYIESKDDEEDNQDDHDDDDEDDEDEENDDETQESSCSTVEKKTFNSLEDLSNGQDFSPETNLLTSLRFMLHLMVKMMMK
ncbi:hypothetical protein FDP41_003466 [Naegleria fowleri]|uniref:Uncharacterized protein n=1 Tax=Naegleria fowleri TaxID=5763 RepID=A0A6A5BTB8_NAEFO|nr:uncharacterized protein FDP41_003466 [Naegleria fowleri]KAF0977474.1 hypothetical protein FDP41_003466 [Naegleria fowleri]